MFAGATIWILTHGHVQLYELCPFWNLGAPSRSPAFCLVFLCLQAKATRDTFARTWAKGKQEKAERKGDKGKQGKETTGKDRKGKERKVKKESKEIKGTDMKGAK